MTGEDRARRWPVLSALGVVAIFNWGSSYYLIAVLAGPVAQDTGWPVAWIIAGLSIALFTSGMVAPLVGDTIRRVGGKGILATASLTLAAGLLILAASPNVAIFLFGWCVLGAGMSMGLYDAAFATLGGIYGVRARSAISTLTLWGGFASTVCWPLTAALTEAAGWRWACVFYAGIHLFVNLPLIWWMVPDASRNATPPAPAARPARLIGAERKGFLIMAAIVTLWGICLTMLSVHLITILQDRQLSLAEAVSIGALIGPAQVAARLGEMLAGGRYHPLWTLVASVLLFATGLVLLASGLPVIGLAVVLYGAGNGIFSIAKGALPLVWFGADRYPSIMGRLARPNQIAQAAAPMLGQFLIANWGVDVTLRILAVLAVVIIALTTMLRREW